LPTIADYLIITDAKFEIQHGTNNSSWSKTFSLENSTSLGSKSILAFILTPGGSGTITFEVKINGVSQASYKLVQAADVSTIHEVINANVLKAGTDANTIQFSITSATGGVGLLEFGDIVLHYQRTI
jgi:hypothetical protein